MYAIGIDIGGTNTRIACIDEMYHIMQRIHFKTDIDNPTATLQQIQDVIDSFHVTVCGVGLSCPGPLDLKHGMILQPPNLNEKWHNFSIQKVLQNLLKLPVYVENDGNLGCLGEAVTGSGRDVDYVSYLSVSTGIGAGYVMHKQIYQGAHGFAQEIANIPLWRDGPRHGTILAGGVEAICSGTAITRRALEAGLSVSETKDVVILAQKGNVHACEILDDAMEYLANTIAIIYAFMDCEMVVMGGSVALKIDGFVDLIEARVKQKVYETIKPYVHVKKAILGDDSGLIGAACLVFRHVNNEGV